MEELSEQSRLTQEFWDWSCQVYQFTNVRQTCLELQDMHQLNVNFLLFAHWASLKDCCLAVSDWQNIEQACSLHMAKVELLRKFRKGIKGLSEKSYQKALSLELQAEKILQKQMLVEVSVLLQKTSKLNNKAHQNLNNYLLHKKASDDANDLANQLQSLINRALD